jgi:hypothetical protein
MSKKKTKKLQPQLAAEEQKSAEQQKEEHAAQHGVQLAGTGAQR